MKIMNANITKLIQRGIAYLVLVLVPILCVNYYVDSYASFRITYNRIGKIAVGSNYCVGTEIPLSERKGKWAKLNYMEPVEHMILGSSRSMLFSSNCLSEPDFYNLGVSGGSSVKDYMAEVYILYKQGKLPQYMMIEVSPSIFNANSGESRWTEWGNSYEYMLGLLNGEFKNSDDSRLLGVQIKDIFSPAYFKYNLVQLKEKKRTYIEKNQYNDNEKLPTWHVDGSYAYSREYQRQNDESTIIAETTSICNSRSVYCCSNYEQLDDELVLNFQKLMSFLEGEGVEVSFYLPPYSEQMYEYICGDDYYKTILDVEEWVLQYGTENGLQIYGSYNPANCELNVTDFYDSYHIKEDKIMDTLWIRNEDAPNKWAQ